MSVSILRGQLYTDDPTAVEHYDFVNYDTNRIIHPLNEPVLQHFFSKLDTLVFLGEGQVNILHIGGSHIQTDLYSHRMRSRLQNLQPGMNGGRGLIFPISMAGTNNPRNFTVTHTGQWRSCRNTQRNRSCNLGLTGFVTVTSDTIATITISIRNPKEDYNTTTIRVFYYDSSFTYRISLATVDPYLIREMFYDPNGGFTDIRLNQSVDTFTLEFFRDPARPGSLELFGIQLLSNDPGIVYHTVGVNGASIPSFLRCNLFGEQLEILHPDLVILSLGTNDAFAKSFDPEIYRQNYSQLIEKIKENCPRADLLITVPNDVWINRRRINRNTTLQEDVIYQLAVTYNAGIWNFFQVMGGLNSVPRWYGNGLMQKDRIHFTPKGYLLKGDLLFSALMKSYGEHLER